MHELDANTLAQLAARANDGFLQHCPALSKCKCVGSSTLNPDYVRPYLLTESLDRLTADPFDCGRKLAAIVSAHLLGNATAPGALPVIGDPQDELHWPNQSPVNVIQFNDPESLETRCALVAQFELRPYVAPRVFSAIPAKPTDMTQPVTDYIEEPED